MNLKRHLFKRSAIGIIASCMAGMMVVGCSSKPTSATTTDTTPAASTEAKTETTETQETATDTTSDTNTEVSAETGADRFNAPGTFPILKETVPLKVGVVQDTNVDRSNNLYTRLLEEQVNVKLTFEELPAGTEPSEQKLALMISSNSKLPDLIVMPLPSIKVYTYGSQGYFIPLEGYLENQSYFIKEGLKEYTDNPMKYVTSIDGHTYGTPRIVEEIGNDWSYRHWINKTWLEKLGLDIPKTTDDYYNALKAFKEKDPNGNGKADEIPLIGSTNGWNSWVYPTLMNAFIYSNKDNNYLLNVNGKVDVAYNKPEWKDGLEYMARLCSDGLFSPMTFTQDTNQLKTLIEDQDAQLIGSLAIGSMSVYKPDSKRKEDMIHLPPLTGPKGANFATLTNSSIPGTWGFITKDCADPEAAFMVLDWMWNTEASMLSRFGEKGVDWKDPDPGVKGLYEDMGYPALVQYVNQIWGTQQNKHWSENTASRRSHAISAGICLNPFNPFDSQAMTAASVPFYVGKAEKDPVRGLIYAPDELEEVSEINASLQTYMEESTVAFITGARPLSDWDNYVAELDRIGLQKSLEYAQKAYDRMK